MCPLLEEIIKSASEAMLGIIKQARCKDDFSLPLFDPSDNLSVRERASYGNARDLFKSDSIRFSNGLRGTIFPSLAYIPQLNKFGIGKS